MNSIFTEENLLAFTTAARFGSFSKAAEELGLTTSAISYTIKRMETGLDVVLFTRSTRSIELTESGRYFFRKATDLLNDFHAIKRSIDTISQGIEARVRICINQLLYTPKHTARLLQVLKKQFPTCQITVTTEVYNGVWDAIINNQANIAIGAPGWTVRGDDIDRRAHAGHRIAKSLLIDNVHSLLLTTARRLPQRTDVAGAHKACCYRHSRY